MRVIFLILGLLIVWAILMAGATVNTAANFFQVSDSQPPTWISFPGEKLSLGERYDRIAEASDPSGVYYIIDDTENFMIDPVSGRIQDTRLLETGTYVFSVTAVDGVGNRNRALLALEVRE